MAEARSLRPGDLLGGRFAILGELGRGGSATVYLVDDRVRGERVALKVLHDHLAADPSARRRLRREVLASSRIRHPAALVANELHEVDGRLALSLPYHAGSTVHELVGQSGPLPGATVESIALQLAEVLTASHRAGVLHRDLSPTNVLVSRDGQVALTDFGLARVGEGGTRSTSTLGTSGYSAPEVWEGSRSDPRSDLYSLGAVVYLAATGRGPFAAPTAVASLQRQLDGAHRPLGEARPDLPAHVCQLVDRLLDVDPERRPAGARAVVDALQTRSLQSAPAEVEARPAVAVGPVRWFDEGGWAVVVREDPDDELRRASLRARTGRKPNLVLEAFASVALQVRDALGMPLSSSPEQALIAEVERVAGLPPGALRAPPAVLDQRFKLIDGVDRHTADRLVASAQNAGFRAEAVDEAPARGWWIPARRVPQILGLTWVVFGMMAMVGADAAAPLLIIAVLLSVFLPQLSSGSRKGVRKTEGLARGFASDLRPWLDEPHQHQLPPGVELAPPEAKPDRNDLPSRAADALASLESTVSALVDTLPEPAIRDLRRTVGVLGGQVEALASRLSSVEAALADARPQDVAWAEARLARLHTLQRAGEAVDPGEFERLSATIDQASAADAASERLEARRTACLAQLLEIASTASRVRHDLLAAPSPAVTVSEQVRRLDADARAIRAALAEGGS